MDVKIAMVGWRGGGPAETADEVQVGLRLPWIEIDGCRISDGLIAANFEAHTDGPGITTLTLALAGRVDLVYTDAKGVPLPGEPILLSNPANLGAIDHRTAVNREDVA